MSSQLGRSFVGSHFASVLRKLERKKGGCFLAGTFRVATTTTEGEKENRVSLNRRQKEQNQNKRGPIGKSGQPIVKSDPT